MKCSLHLPPKTSFCLSSYMVMYNHINIRIEHIYIIHTQYTRTHAQRQTHTHILGCNIYIDIYVYLLVLYSVRSCANSCARVMFQYYKIITSVHIKNIIIITINRNHLKPEVGGGGKQ